METTSQKTNCKDKPRVRVVRQPHSPRTPQTEYAMELRSRKRKRESEELNLIESNVRHEPTFKIDEDYSISDGNKICLINCMKSFYLMYSSFDGKILSAQTKAVIEEFITQFDWEDAVPEVGSQTECFDYTDALRCSNCYSHWMDPITLECGHTYCSECLMKFSPGDLCKKCSNKITCMDIYQSKIDVVSSATVGKCWPFIATTYQLRNEAKRCELLSQLNESVSKYSEAIQLNSEDHISWGDRALVQLKLNNLEDALQDSETAIKLCPLWPEGYLRKVSALMKIGHYDEAFVQLTICLYLVKKNKSRGLTVLGTFRDEFVKIANQIFVQSSGIVVSEIANFHQKARVQSSHTKKPKMCMKELTNIMTDSNERLKEFEIRISNLLIKTAAALSDLKPQLVSLTAIDIPNSVGSEIKTKLAVSDLECSICYRLFLEPVVTPCGHTYCQTCLRRCLKHSSDCPMCKRSLHKCINQQFHVTEFLDTVIQRYFKEEYKERLRQQIEDNSSGN